MAYLLNSNVQKIQTKLQEEQTLIDEASVVIGRVKHGWYSQHIQTHTSNETLGVLKEGINEMISATKGILWRLIKPLKSIQTITIQTN